MIWPFKPHPPLPLIPKVACERRFAVIARLLGQQRLSTHAVVAVQDMEPLITDCAHDDLPARLFQFIAGRIIPNSNVSVSWGDGETMTENGQAVHYVLTDQSGQGFDGINLHPEMATSPIHVAAIVAAAAAELLIRSESLAENIPQGTFEILPLFFGFGPVMADAALREFSQSESSGTKWDTSRIGTVSPLEFGYTMALSDWAVDTSYESVTSLLRLDAREGLDKGGRFLRKTADCSLNREFLTQPPELSLNTVTSDLEARCHSRQLNTLYDLQQTDEIDPQLIPTIAGLLGHSELEIQRLATTVLGRCRNLPRPIHDELLIQTENGPAALRRAAISALQRGFDNDIDVQEVLTSLLARTDAVTATHCIQTLLKYDTHPENLADAVLSGLRTMVLSSGTPDLARGIELLQQVHTDPTAALQQHFSEDPTALAIFDEILAGEASIA